MFKIDNLGEFNGQLDAWLADVTRLTEEAFRGYAIEAFKHVLQISPQYSGDFTSNWRFSVNEPDTTFEPGSLNPIRGIVDPFIAGDPEAIALAISRNTGKELPFKLGDTIYISNSATHDEPYAFKIENGTIDFRDGNEGHVIEYTVAAMEARVPAITAAYARKLAAERIE